ncbi:Protein PS1 [Dietzia timorensis]|nr:Protein PS1 [Dietzia timorensis]
MELGAEAGSLMYPTSNELPCPNRGFCSFNRFETGNIYWSPTTNAQAVWGAIFQEYGRQGYENGRFGLPTTSEFDTPDGKQVNFEGGWIRWIRNTGALITS